MSTPTSAPCLTVGCKEICDDSPEKHQRAAWRACYATNKLIPHSLFMIACVIHRAKDLKVEKRPEPQPGAGEVIIRFGAGGDCRSDLHYYHEGRVGNFELREPLILGHELAGQVVEIGEGVTKVKVGQRVAVNPTRPCLHCHFCLSGRSNLCKNVRFFGSASRFPHVQGGFAELFTASEGQCVPIPGFPLLSGCCLRGAASCHITRGGSSRIFARPTSDDQRRGSDRTSHGGRGALGWCGRDRDHGFV